RDGAMPWGVSGPRPPNEGEPLSPPAVVVAPALSSAQDVIENFVIHIQSWRKRCDWRDRRKAGKEQIYIRHVVIIPVSGAGVSQAGIDAGFQDAGEIPLKKAVVASLFKLEAGSCHQRRARADAEEVPSRGQKVVEPEAGVVPFAADTGEVGFELGPPEKKCAGERHGAPFDPGKFVGGSKFEAQAQPGTLVKTAHNRINVLGAEPDCGVIFGPPRYQVIAYLYPVGDLGRRRRAHGSGNLRIGRRGRHQYVAL